MGMKKATTATPATATPVTTHPVAENGTAAAISRLKKTTEVAADKKSAGRDYNEEARGKTRCVQFEAALMSPAIAGMKWDNIDQYLALCKQAADFGTDYTFGELKDKK